MFNKAVFFINPIIEFAKINNRSVSGTALNVITRIGWLASVVLSPSAVLTTPPGDCAWRERNGSATNHIIKSKSRLIILLVVYNSCIWRFKNHSLMLRCCKVSVFFIKLSNNH